jgi:hypothetical protein
VTSLIGKRSFSVGTSSHPVKSPISFPNTRATRGGEWRYSCATLVFEETVPIQKAFLRRFWEWCHQTRKPIRSWFSAEARQSLGNRWGPKYGNYDFWGWRNCDCARLWHLLLRDSHSLEAGSREEPRLITRQEEPPRLVPCLLKVFQEALSHCQPRRPFRRAESLGNPV